MAFLLFFKEKASYPTYKVDSDWSSSVQSKCWLAHADGTL